MSVTFRQCLPTDEDMERFWSKVYVDPNSGCWLWAGSTSAGHGQFGLRKTNGGVFPAHVVSFCHKNGPLPFGTLLHHKCNTGVCVNPAHLEISTDKFNGDYAMNACAVNARKTHCPHGHEYTPDNVYIVNKSKGIQGSRRCKTCDKERYSAKQARRKAQQTAWDEA